MIIVCATREKNVVEKRTGIKGKKGKKASQRDSMKRALRFNAGIKKNARYINGQAQGPAPTTLY
jgi:hypothetical protein